MGPFGEVLLMEMLQKLEMRLRDIEIKYDMGPTICSHCKTFPVMAASGLCARCYEESGECIHEWCYSPIVYAMDPPVYHKICRKCGKKEREQRNRSKTGEYDSLVEKFEKLSQKEPLEAQS